MKIDIYDILLLLGMGFIIGLRMDKILFFCEVEVCLWYEKKWIIRIVKWWVSELVFEWLEFYVSIVW